MNYNNETQHDQYILASKPVTAGENGYPSPEVGTFIYGFDSRAELEAYLEQHPDATAAIAFWRDGWNHCEVTERTTVPEPFDATASMGLGEVYNDLDALKDELAADGHALAFEGFLARFDIQNVDWQKNLLIKEEGSVEYEEVPRQTLHAAYDGKHWVIGAFVPVR